MHICFVLKYFNASKLKEESFAIYQCTLCNLYSQIKQYFRTSCTSLLVWWFFSPLRVHPVSQSRETIDRYRCCVSLSSLFLFLFLCVGILTWRVHVECKITRKQARFSNTKFDISYNYLPNDIWSSVVCRK